MAAYAIIDNEITDQALSDEYAREIRRLPLLKAGNTSCGAEPLRWWKETAHLTG